MLHSIRGLREESGYCFPREFDTKFVLVCGLQINVKQEL